jgi:GNAT superfamily N-acetyltransferase
MCLQTISCRKTRNVSAIKNGKMTQLTATTILEADRSHAAVLRELSEQTFRETYAAGTDPGSLNLHVRRHFTVPVIEADLQNLQTKYLLAQHEAQWVGYALLRLNHPHELLRGTAALQLDRIYVLQDFLRHKIGSILLQYTIDFARQAGYEWLWLMVWEENKRALAFYKKWGFEHFGYHPFQFGEDWYEDLALRLKIQ